jgi:hypothetical protein
MVKLFTRIYAHQFVSLILLVAVGLIISIVSPSPFVNFIVLLFSIFALSGVMPTTYSNLRIVYAFAYIAIGFGLYLVLRGFFQTGPVSKYDFAICISLLVALALSPKYLGRGKGAPTIRVI